MVLVTATHVDSLERERCAPALHCDFISQRLFQFFLETTVFEVLSQTWYKIYSLEPREYWLILEQGKGWYHLSY